MAYYLYILHCSDDSLYTGITTDVERRLEAHREGKGSKYVAAHLPCEVVYTENFENRSEASKREAFIKNLSKSEKQQLILISEEKQQ